MIEIRFGGLYEKIFLLLVGMVLISLVSCNPNNTETSTTTTIDSTIPVINLVSPTNGEIISGHTVGIYGIVSDDQRVDLYCSLYLFTNESVSIPLSIQNAIGNFEKNISSLSTGEYNYKLMVYDSDNNSSSVDFTFSISNNAPICDAGTNQIIAWDEEICLEGSASDLDGNSLTYSWTQLSGPTNVQLIGDETLSPTFSNQFVPGDYEFELVANDGVNECKDTVSISCTLFREKSPQGYIVGSGLYLIFLLMVISLLLALQMGMFIYIQRAMIILF